MTFCSALRPVFVVLFALTTFAVAQKNTPAPLPPASNGNEISPPFSLVWHEPSDRMESKIGSAKLNIIERRKVGPRWAVTVTGFKKPDPADKTAPKPPLAAPPHDFLLMSLCPHFTPELAPLAAHAHPHRNRAA